MAQLDTVTDQDFAKTIADADTPVLVDFTAAWCPPCQILKPILSEIASEYEGKLRITALDVDENPRTTLQFGVQGMPTMIVFKGGKPVERLLGFMPKKRLLEKLSPHFDE